MVLMISRLVSSRTRWGATTMRGSDGPAQGVSGFPVPPAPPTPMPAAAAHIADLAVASECQGRAQRESRWEPLLR